LEEDITKYSYKYVSLNNLFEENGVDLLWTDEKIKQEYYPNLYYIYDEATDNYKTVNDNSFVDTTYESTYKGKLYILIFYLLGNQNEKE
jgi:hypothetical protein